MSIAGHSKASTSDLKAVPSTVAATGTVIRSTSDDSAQTNSPSQTPAAADAAAESPIKEALDELSQAQTQLVAGTWRSGKLAAGVAAIAPQVLIATAQLSLNTWANSIDGARNFFADTEGIPIIHDVARINLALTVTLPSVSQAAMSGATQLLPAVGFFGGQDAESHAVQLLSDAQRDGMAYATVPVVATDTRAIVYISVNGGERVPVILDTGSKGLVIDPRYVPVAGLGPYEDNSTTCPSPSSDGHCTGGYSKTDSWTFEFDVYTTTVDFGNGIVTDPTFVNVVTQDTLSDFEKHLEGGTDSAGAVGILGIGPGSDGPGISSVTNALPGALGTGMLLDEGNGYLVFGYNPLPAKAVLDGAPHTKLTVKVDDGTPQSVDGSLDSGGVYGTIPSFLVPEWGLSAGTVISVYTADGRTLLCSYTITDQDNEPTVVDSAYYNTGYEAFLSGPVYVDFTESGSTSFDYTWR
ncbi:hypothetical protein BH09ACT8_BH09ACT8_37650 [soil metagenome]